MNPLLYDLDIEGILPKGPYLSWRAGPFLQDTLDISVIVINIHDNLLKLFYDGFRGARKRSFILL